MADMDRVPGDGVLRPGDLTVGMEAVLRRLRMGPGGAPPGGRMGEIVERAVASGRGAVEPAAVYRTLEIAAAGGRSVAFRGTSFAIRSARVAELLAPCRRATILAATVGEAVTRAAAALMAAGRMTEAMALDAYGSEAVEALAGLVSRTLGRLAARDGLEPTMRFSPGYGDWGLDAQGGLLDEAGAAGIGIRLGEACILVPEKSITAVIGWRAAKGGDG
ncbi:MAG: hypothetical protein PHN82_08625 [bacterium]|nr:hypothetical protein [bacterium]